VGADSAGICRGLRAWGGGAISGAPRRDHGLLADAVRSERMRRSLGRERQRAVNGWRAAVNSEAYWVGGCRQLVTRARRGSSLGARRQGPWRFARSPPRP
jgi:hypothetical protein